MRCYIFAVGPFPRLDQTETLLHPADQLSSQNKDSPQTSSDYKHKQLSCYLISDKTEEKLKMILGVIHWELVFSFGFH